MDCHNSTKLKTPCGKDNTKLVLSIISGRQVNRQFPCRWPGLNITQNISAQQKSLPQNRPTKTSAVTVSNYKKYIKHLILPINP